MNYLLGIDIGTTNSKAILFDEDGVAVASGSGGYETHYPGPNMAEQDGDDWWSAVCSSIQQITSAFDISSHGKLAGISISSQAPSLLPVDQSGHPLRRAPIWMDRRAGKEHDMLVSKIGFNRFESIVGGRPDSFYLLSKLYWYKHNEPENFARTATVLQANGYAVFKLTGKFSIDTTHAIMTHCMDVSTMKWSSEISAVSGLNFDEILPPIYKNTDIVGTVTTEAAKETGLPAGVPVIAGTTDSIASMVGLGLTEPGMAAEVTGTSSLVYVALDKLPPTSGKLSIRPSPIPSIPYLLLGPASTTGASLKWFDLNFGQPERLEEAETGINRYQLFDRLASTADAGSGGVIYFPYMMGERAPLWNSHAKGMFIGMTLSTGRAEYVRAILEGTSFCVRHILDDAQKSGATINHVRSSGGGSKSDIWLQIKASMLHQPIHVPDAKTGDVPFGDALLAGAAVGIYPDIGKSAKELVKIKRIIDPIPEWERRYDELYQLFINMYKHLDADLVELQRIVSTFN